MDKVLETIAQTSNNNTRAAIVTKGNIKSASELQGKPKAQQGQKSKNMSQAAIEKKRNALVIKQSFEIKSKFEKLATVWQEKLIADCTEETLIQATRYITLQSYQQVIIERNAENKCGYPLCSNPPTKTDGRFKISLKTREIISTTDMDSFSSKRCMAASKYYALQIPIDPPYIRSRNEVINIELFPHTETNPAKAEKERISRLENLDWYKRQLMKNFIAKLTDEPKASIEIVEIPPEELGMQVDSLNKERKITVLLKNTESYGNDGSLVDDQNADLFLPNQNQSHTQTKSEGCPGNTISGELSQTPNRPSLTATAGKKKVQNTDSVIKPSQKASSTSKKLLSSSKALKKSASDSAKDEKWDDKLETDSDSDFDDEWWELDDGDDGDDDGGGGGGAGAEAGVQANGSVLGSKRSYSDDYNSSIPKQLPSHSLVKLNQNISFFGQTWLLLDKLCTKSTKNYYDLKRKHTDKSCMDLSNFSLLSLDSAVNEENIDEEMVRNKQKQILAHAVSQHLISMKRVVYIAPMVESDVFDVFATFAVDNKMAAIGARSMTAIVLAMINALMESSGICLNLTSSAPDPPVGTSNLSDGAPGVTMATGGDSVSDRAYFGSRSVIEMNYNSSSSKNRAAFLRLSDSYKMDIVELNFLSKRFLSNY